MIYELTGPRTLIKKETSVVGNSFGPNWAFARTLISAISPGTELAAWMGKPPLRPSNPYPRLVGYCNVARVQTVGSSITDLAAGDVILTHQSHRTDFLCSGKDVLLNVGNAEPAAQRLLATTYLYHLGYSALTEGGYRPGSEVAIVGLGALGFTTASLVSAYGGTPWVFSGKENARSILSHVRYSRSLAKSSLPESKRWCSGIDGADIVVNTSDSWDDYRLCLNLVRTGGIVVLLGFPGRGGESSGFNPLDSKYMYDKNITLRQAGHVPDLDVSPADLRFNLKRNLAHIFSLLETGRLDAAPLCGSVFASLELQGAYEMLERHPEGVLSAILDWTC